MSFKYIQNNLYKTSINYICSISNEAINTVERIKLTLIQERQAEVIIYSSNDYQIFYNSLKQLHDITKTTSTIGFVKIECGMDWDILELMIKKVLSDRQVYISGKKLVHKSKIYCCYSQSDIGRNIDKFIEEHPKAEIVNYSLSGDELLWFLMIIYKE